MLKYVPCISLLHLLGALADYCSRAQGVNCCAAARLLLDSGPDGGSCPPVGACRGFEGTCGQLAAQFAEVPVLPDFPNGLADWTCTAFPDDNNPVDSFVVGLVRAPRLMCWATAADVLIFTLLRPRRSLSPSASP